MPAVGLGTFQVKEEAGYEAVKAAIKVRSEKMFRVRVCISSLRRSIGGPPASQALEYGMHSPHLFVGGLLPVALILSNILPQKKTMPFSPALIPI
jgi:hypothetical protein